MTEEKFSPAESLQLIQSMINKTKQNISNKSIYFLIWGWLTFIACTGQFILKHIYNYPRHYQVWWVIVLGVFFSAYYSFIERKKQKVKTYIGDSVRSLWLGMGLAYFALSMILVKLGFDKPIFPFYILLYALGTFITGSIIRFRPLIIGGFLAFGLAVGCVYAEYDYQMLFGAIAILVSYIIPAYILRAKEKLVS
jgi:hypothetical protein